MQTTLYILVVCLKNLIVYETLTQVVCLSNMQTTLHMLVICQNTTVYANIGVKYIKH
jgi:hypothetical protein